MRIAIAIALWYGISTAAIAQLQPPTDLDLKASYCLRLIQDTLSDLKDYVPGKDESLDNLVRDARDRADRLRSYLFPRVPYLDATGLLAASQRADVDRGKYLQIVSACTGGDCAANETPTQCAVRKMACVKGDAVERVYSCAKLTWLPF